MSSVVIAGDTSGSITVSAPAVAGSNTLTLPAATGTVIYADGSGNLQANSGYGSVATGYLCRAWVNFNGTGTVAIRGSGNVTSITDNGTGNYTVNFTTVMPDANYFVATGIGKGALGVNDVIQGSARLAPITSTSSHQIGVVTATANAFTDAEYVCYAVFR